MNCCLKNHGRLVYTATAANDESRYKGTLESQNHYNIQIWWKGVLCEVYCERVEESTNTTLRPIEFLGICPQLPPGHEAPAAKRNVKSEVIPFWRVSVRIA